MANWLKDVQASQAEGRLVFKLPYPGGTWVEEKQRNKELLLLMETAWRVARVGFKQKRGETLTKDENLLLDEIANHLKLEDHNGARRDN